MLDTRGANPTLYYHTLPPASGEHVACARRLLESYDVVGRTAELREFVHLLRVLLGMPRSKAVALPLLPPSNPTPDQFKFKPTAEQRQLAAEYNRGDAAVYASFCARDEAQCDEPSATGARARMVLAPLQQPSLGAFLKSDARRACEAMWLTATPTLKRPSSTSAKDVFRARPVAQTHLSWGQERQTLTELGVR